MYMKLTWRILARMLVGIVPAMLITPTGRALGLEFDLQVVDDIGEDTQFGAQRLSLALDPMSGLPSLAYSDASETVDGSPDLKFAAFDGARWNIETVDFEGIVGLGASLVFQPSSGLPSIAYRKEGELMFAEREEGSWKFTRISSSVSQSSVELVLNPISLHPAVAHFVHIPHMTNLVFTTFNGSEWNTEIIAEGPSSSGEGFHDISLAMDPETGRPYIAFTQFIVESTHLRVAHFNGNNWEIDDDVSPGSKPSLAIDPKTGDLWISHRGGLFVSGAPRFSTRSEGVWTTMPAPRAGKIAVDPLIMQPRIAAAMELEGVQLASFDGEQFLLETVDDASGAFRQPDMAIDEQSGRIFIAYFAGDTGELKIATSLVQESKAEYFWVQYGARQ